MSTEIKCPKCGTIFTVDESEYATLLEQVRTKEFDASVKKETDRIMRDMKKDAELAAMKAAAENANIVAQKDTYIAELKAKLEHESENLTYKIEKAVAEKEKEIYELKANIQTNKDSYSEEKRLLVAQYQNELNIKDETIALLKDYRVKLSTKMVGEDLEQHCENKFNEMRMVAFPNAEFSKDNDAKSGSKGDYIYRETAEDGTEILSIMFEMKNEMETTATKHKNEHFFAELDKDRREKKCEYAILVSMLEQDSELYNTGIVDVSYKYEKMYVIRPQFFIQIISILRNAALNSLKYKQEAEMVKRQNIDVTNFESELNEFKDKFGKNYKDASDRFSNAIDEIDATIQHLMKVKDNLLKSEKHLTAAERKLDTLTIKKLTSGNATMKAMFAELESKSNPAEALNGKVEENKDSDEQKSKKQLPSWITKKEENGTHMQSSNSADNVKTANADTDGNSESNSNSESEPKKVKTWQDVLDYVKAHKNEAK